MKKISINLSPQKETVATALLERVVSYTPSVGLTAVLVLAIIIFLQMFVFKQAYQYSGYSRKWKQWEGKYRELKKIKEGTAELEEEKQKLEEVATAEYDIVRILDDIFSALPGNIWFEGLEFKEGFINLRGYAVTWGEDYLVSLEGFINSLRKREYFSSRYNKVSIRESKRTSLNGVETLKFIIECKK
jgi:Tfp pilus assembly protein PilN